ncbi:DUF4492 domain-containing protein [Caenorhabditis elegans]|uniref:DUF4492 domain-containing protein n=1 Tax=Caenorhabditis elegans TaxID=6239 RepID=Q9TZD1_CAEEL|nr:DUF4492 domain-containing protein [Caenorhabditis elegans]CCD68420.2 DUF4492 domain-containing protein [Caenorhabditis elegans]
MNQPESVYMCSAFREDDLFRRFFAIFSWLLKVFTFIIFFATIRLHDQQRNDPIEHENAVQEVDDVRRYRRVAYRPRQRNQE